LPPLPPLPPWTALFSIRQLTNLGLVLAAQ